MSNEKVTITFSTAPGHKLAVETHVFPTSTHQQVDLFLIAEEPADISVGPLAPGLASSNASAIGTDRRTLKPPTCSSTTASAERRAVANESLPAPALQAAEPRAKPWEDLSHGSKGLNLPMSAELYAKMRWCNENVPKMSLQKLARMGAEKLADELIAKHYKGE